MTRSIFHNVYALALYGAMAALATAIACGPDFSVQLLDDRAGTLGATPANSFAFEAAALASPMDSLKANETAVPFWAEPEQSAAAPASDTDGLTDTQAAKVMEMRAAATGDAAYALGESVPEAARLYVAGAVDYRAADPWCGPREPVWNYYEEPEKPARQTCDRDAAPLLTAAEARFSQILSLPEADARPRAVWASYMLGQIHAARSVMASEDANAGRREIETAARFFTLARTRAVAGDPDPDGLAVASYGEEARLYLSAHGCGWADFLNTSNCPAAIPVADLKRMIGLYAEQAARGSDGAVQSLAAIAGWSLRDDARSEALVDDPMAQRLLVAYALARALPADDPTASEPNAQRASLVTLVHAVEALGVDRVRDADRLAALAYGAGMYDVAERFLQKGDGPLAQWVAAKLQLRRGDMAGAALSYARAAKAFPEVEKGLTPENARLLKGEQGVLFLARGEYTEALMALYDAALHRAPDTYSDMGYDQDAFYVAERVLTADELKSFVDRRAPEQPAAKADSPQWGDPKYTVPLSLRWLLARRLMREGRHDEALPYYPVANPPYTTEIDVRGAALKYMNALKAADGAWTKIGEARGLFQAAVIARTAGMEIMGYEQTPDQASLGGNYPDGYGRQPEWCGKVTTNTDGSVTRVPGPPTGAFVTRDECQRYNATTARPDYRYHYRYVAADLAAHAADRLPPRSQAFAAVLCRAVGWTLLGEGDTGQRLYRRYVAEGAYVPWAVNFGSNCEAPDFDAGRWFTVRQAYRDTRHWLAGNWILPLGGLLALGVLAIVLIRRRPLA